MSHSNSVVILGSYNGLAKPVAVASDGTFAVAATAAAVATGGYTKTLWTNQTTTVRTVKGTAGKLGGWFIYNPDSAAAFVQLFDVASATAVTLGVTVPDMVLPLPTVAAANLLSDVGIDFALGIKFAITTTATGSTANGSGLTVTLFYK